MKPTMPKRIQRKRTRGWKMPPNAVYVGRPTRWGNPYRLPDYIGDDLSRRTFCCQDFRDSLVYDIGAVRTTAEEIRRELRGKDLACWCPLDQPCHADVLLEIANAEVEP